MRLQLDYLNQLHLKNDDYQTIEKAKNDSEKVALLIKVVQELQNQIDELTICLRAKGSL
jgi:hypothetical protein